ncbi:MAG: hypothetical protein QNJ33_00180 [Crocosphaera sp.]|nr:hypothetical protein [Crocosphaera sp.]
MAFFRQYIAPMLILLIFLVALVAVTARAFLPSDLSAPAPIDDISYLQLSVVSPLDFIHFHH